MKDWLGSMGNTGLSRYFTAMLLVFLASFLLLPSTKMVNNVYYAFLALPALGVLLWRRGKGARLSVDMFGWMLLLAWSALVGVWSGDFQHYKHVLYVGLFVYLVVNLVFVGFFREAFFARGLFWVLCIYISGSAMFYWLFGYYEFGERVLWLPGRMTGPIYTSMWLVCCFALALPAWFRMRLWPEALMALVWVIFCVSFILQSRSGLVGLAVLILLVAIYFSMQRLSYALTAAGVVFALLFAVAIGQEFSVIASLFQRADAHRFELWSILVRDWIECGVWLGCGINYVTGHALSNGMPIPHPHNIFLALGLYSGLVSLLIFLFLMSWILRVAWVNHDSWGLYLLMALVMLNFDGSKIIGNPDELWLLVLLPAGLIANFQNNKRLGRIM